MENLFIGDMFQPRPRLTVFCNFRLHIEPLSVPPKGLESDHRLIWMHRYICRSSCNVIVAFDSGCKVDKRIEFAEF